MPKNDVLNYLKNNNIWIKGICTILIIVYILFPFLDNQLSDSFFLKKNISEYHSFSFIYWIICSAIIMYNIYCLFIRKYVYSKFYLFTTTVLSISYFFIRLDDSLRTHIKFSEIDRYLNTPFYYLDILLFILIFNIIHLIIRSCEEIFPKSEIIYFTDSNHDDEILNDDDNLYELQNYIDNINDLITRQTPKRTFTISINSKWGTGKTFFLDKLEKKLNESNEIIIIPFNAWKFEDSPSLLKEYFDTIGKELSKYDANASKAFHNYVLSIFNYGGVNLKSFVEGISDYLIGNRDNSLNKTKQIVKNLDKKIVIIIDDIDRLKKKELFEVLKLIRNLSDYPNFFIITTIDNNYLLKEGKLDGSYLEKIFNLQIDLPLINNYTLNEYYNKCINVLLDKEIAKLIIENTNKIFNESIFFNTWHTFNDNINPTIQDSLVNVQLKLIYFLDNRRQIKRFINNLKFAHYTKINESDLLLDKYILVNLLIFKYPIMKYLMSIENIRYYTTNNNQGKLVFDSNKFLDFVEKQNVDLSIYDKSILVASLDYIFSNHANLLNDISNEYYYQIYLDSYTNSLSRTEIIEKFKSNELKEFILKYLDSTDLHFIKKVLIEYLDKFDVDKISELIIFLSDEKFKILNGMDFLEILNKIEENKLSELANLILSEEFINTHIHYKNVIKNYYYLLIDPEKRKGDNVFAVYLQYDNLKNEVKEVFSKERIQKIIVKDLEIKSLNLNYENKYFNPLENELFYSYNYHTDIIKINTFYPEAKIILKSLLRNLEFRTYIILCYNYSYDSKRIFEIYSMLMMDDQEQKDFEEIANLGVIYGFDKVRSTDINNDEEMLEKLKLINNFSFIIYDLERLKSLFKKIKNEDITYVSYVEKIKSNNLEKFKRYLGLQD